MKKIQIGPPLSNTNQSEISHIFSLLSILFFGIILGYSAIISPELKTSIVTGMFSLFMFIMSVLLISQRRKYKRNAMYIDDVGLTFKDGRQNILWEDIEEIFLTYAIKKEKNETFTGYPFLFLKLKVGYPHNDSILKVGEMDVPYIVSKDYFEKYIGKSKDFTIGLNIENATESISKTIIENLPLKVLRVRPLIEVNTKEEYNKKILEFISPEMQKEYILE